MYSSLVMFVVSSIFSPPTINKSWNFAVIGDTQANKYIMVRAIKNMNKHKFDLVVHVGDMDAYGDPRRWRKSMSYILKSKCPWFYVIGNHELYSNNPFRYFPTKRKWVRFWYGWGDTFRVFSHRRKKFILIDSSSSFMPNSHHKRLERALKRAKNKSVFLFTHKPLPYYKNFKIYYDNGKRYVRYRWMCGLPYKWSNITLWKIIKRHKNKIIAVFHGHDHSYRKYSIEGIQVYCSGGGGGKLETKYDYYHYLNISVDKNGYSVKIIKL